jgi:hypothetical protein
VDENSPPWRWRPPMRVAAVTADGKLHWSPVRAEPDCPPGRAACHPYASCEFCVRSVVLPQVLRRHTAARAKIANMFCLYICHWLLLPRPSAPPRDTRRARHITALPFPWASLSSKARPDEFLTDQSLTPPPNSTRRPDLAVGPVTFRSSALIHPLQSLQTARVWGGWWGGGRWLRGIVSHSMDGISQPRCRILPEHSFLRPPIDSFSFSFCSVQGKQAFCKDEITVSLH